MKHILFVLLLVLTSPAWTQITQTVRGKVVDQETNVPIPGVRIQIVTDDTLLTLRALTDLDGVFSIQRVPIGKHQLVAKSSGFEPRSITITVNSGKESIVDFGMAVAFLEKEEVTITGRRKGETINELAIISAQQFSVEETDRYPGSRSDPARMASNFAGVQGADDSRNDIIIRGNSPLGVVWRIEGIDIPNPNHFATSGSTGGPVSILNNKMMANSDFFMSAFPAEYGNSTSGIFDLRLRNGNNKLHELTGQFGFLGTELMAEGPLSKSGRSSYLIMGRYSTLSMFKAMGIQIGTDAVPAYADASFKLNWQLKNGGNLSWFGIGGNSNIEIKISEQKEYAEEFYGEGDRDQYFGTRMGVTGLVYKKPLSERTFLHATVAASHEKQRSNHNYLIRNLDTTAAQEVFIRIDSIYPLMGYSFEIGRVTSYLGITHRFNRRHLIKAGFNFEGQFISMLDSALTNVLSPNTFQLRWNYRGHAALIQPFVQWKFRISEDMDLTAGIHSQYYSMSNSISPVEPRLGWKYRFKKNQSFSAGAGLHSQTQPMYTYFYSKQVGNERIMHNQRMGFMKSIHTALGYELMLPKSLQIKSEVYYQHLYDVPVDITPTAFSLINMGSGFQRFFPDSLVNEGTGTNYGIELTVQKFFDKSFFFLFTASLYNSTYKGSDGITRNTSFNGNYATNFLAGKEFKLNERQSISAGLKITWAGGRRYGYVDLAKSEQMKEIIFRDTAFNELQFKDYFRFDLKVNWKLNTSKMTHEIGLDLVNVFNTDNLLGLAYAPSLDPKVNQKPGYQPVAFKKQLGFLPIFYYKVDFRIRSKETQQP